tara:strand:+ start:53024 stop:53953 length:930 start_codon:yes stop_codon:yes gene_type:complete
MFRIKSILRKGYKMINNLTDIELITFAPSATVAVAKKYGFFEYEGLNVKETRTPSSSEQMRGLIEERYQIASTAFDNVLAWSNREGLEILAIAKASSMVKLPMYVTSEISSWTDIKGKVLAVDAIDTAYALVLRRILLEHDLVLDRDYTFHPAGSTGFRFESMESGKTCGAILNPPWNKKAEDVGMKLFANHNQVLPDYPGGTYAVSKDWAMENHDLVISFLRAMLRATDIIYTNPDSKEILSTVEQGLSVSANEAKGILSRVPFNLNLSAKELQIPLDLRSDFGYQLHNGIEVENYLDKSYLLEIGIE